MPLIARRPADDLRRFVALTAVPLALAAAGVGAVRASHGDGPAATDPAFGLVVMLLSAAALAGAALIGCAASLGLTVLLAPLAGVALAAGGALLLELILPIASERAGPGAMALILPALAGLAAVPAGLMLRLVRLAIARR